MDVMYFKNFHGTTKNMKILRGKFKVVVPRFDTICLGVICLLPRHKQIASVTHKIININPELTPIITMVGKLTPSNKTLFLSAT